MRRSLLAALFATMVVALSLPGDIAAAQGSGTPTYNVEIIVFRMNGPREGEPGASAPRAAAADAASGAAQVARYIGPLAADKLQLSGARQKLAAAGYRVLAHTGWTQTASSWGSRNGLPVERLGVQVPGLSGNFVLERGSLLHFGMNLRYAPEGGAVHFLNDLRRIRFNEKNYYDHPGLGVIAVVTPGGR